MLRSDLRIWHRQAPTPIFVTMQHDSGAGPSGSRMVGRGGDANPATTPGWGVDPHDPLTDKRRDRLAHLSDPAAALRPLVVERAAVAALWAGSTRTNWAAIDPMDELASRLTGVRQRPTWFRASCPGPCPS